MAKSRAEISREQRLKKKGTLSKHIEALNIPIHTDLYNALNEVIKDMNLKQSELNNLYLEIAFKDQYCNSKQYKQIKNADIKVACNNLNSQTMRIVDNRLKKYFRYHPQLKCSYEYLKYDYFTRRARSWKIKVKNEDDFTFISAKVMKESLKEWKIGSKEYYLKQLENIEDPIYQKLMFIDKGEKESPYKDVEKNFRGYHSERTETEELIKQRFQNNVYLKNDYLIQKVNEMFNNNKVDISIGLEINKILEGANNKTFTYSHGRIYCNGFHNCSKEWRDKIFYYVENGEYLLKEIFDVKSCFWTFTFLLYSKDAVRDQEWSKLYDLIINGDLYVEFQNYLKLESRDEAKKMLIQWLFSSKKVKEYRRNVNKFFKLKFPRFYNWVINREEITDGDETKSVLSVQCQWFENALINELFELVKGLKAVTLHDAIWISEDQFSEELKNKIEEAWRNIIKRELTKSKEEQQIQMLTEGLEEALQYNNNYWKTQKEKLKKWKENYYG